jgi:hypothetical protein
MGQLNHMKIEVHLCEEKIDQLPYLSVIKHPFFALNAGQSPHNSGQNRHNSGQGAYFGSA